MWPSCLPPPSASLPSSCPQTHSPSHVAGHSRWTADIHLASCARRCSPHKSLFICEIALPALYSAASQASLANPSPLHSSCPADSRFGTDSSKARRHYLQRRTQIQLGCSYLPARVFEFPLHGLRNVVSAKLIGADHPGSA